MKKNYLFICDSSTSIGSGHVARCINLARSVSEETSGDCIFFHRNLPGAADFLIERAGFQLEKYQDFFELSKLIENKYPWKIDSIIFDNYFVDADVEQSLSKYTKKILVIDDIFNRRHQCDFLLNQNLIPNAHAQYKNLVNPECRFFFGPEYALVGAEYRKSQHMVIRENIVEVLVFFGGTDPMQGTLKCLDLCARLPHLSFTFIVGQSCTHRSDLEYLARVHRNATVVVQAPSLLPFFLKSDLYLGAGGSVSWERVSTGLPGVVLSVADNQIEMSEQLHNKGVQVYLGMLSDVSLETIEQSLKTMDYGRRQKFQKAGLGLKIASKIPMLVREIA